MYNKMFPLLLTKRIKKSNDLYSLFYIEDDYMTLIIILFILKKKR